MIVNVIGKGEGWEEGYNAPGEKWSINYWHPNADVLFNIHPQNHEYYIKNIREIDNAKAAGIPIVTYDSLEDIQSNWGVDYFGSSTDWLIAEAIGMEVEEIHLWGVTMNDVGDHYEKRCATDFWCGVAMGRGIKVVVHGNSRVMTTEDGLTYGTFKPMNRRFIE